MMPWGSKLHKLVFSMESFGTSIDSFYRLGLGVYSILGKRAFCGENQILTPDLAARVLKLLSLASTWTPKVGRIMDKTT